QYTITDGDGDTSPATLTIAVSNGEPQPVAAIGTVDEAGLPSGSSPSVALTQAGGTLNLGDPDSPHVTHITGSRASNNDSAVNGSAVTVNGQYGTLQIDGSGNYTYTLTTPETSSPAADDGTNIQSGTDVFTYTVTDQFGNTNTSTITISITDDVPTAHNDSD